MIPARFTAYTNCSTFERQDSGFRSCAPLPCPNILVGVWYRGLHDLRVVLRDFFWQELLATNMSITSPDPGTGRGDFVHNTVSKTSMRRTSISFLGSRTAIKTQG